ncbi:hypothetical protein BaRGS_00023666 [Batillaria attramentaria]|uniref:Uncharacterized protein n=1 Tax=Batillaria attramentaria TaxID=370345 RepID=A0ABD0KDC5_9CAEN
MWLTGAKDLDPLCPTSRNDVGTVRYDVRTSRSDVEETAPFQAVKLPESSSLLLLLGYDTHRERELFPRL